MGWRPALKVLRTLLLVSVLVGGYLIWQRSWALAVEQVSDLVALVLLAAVLTATTAVDDILEVVTTALAPDAPARACTPSGSRWRSAWCCARSRASSRSPARPATPPGARGLRAQPAGPAHPDGHPHGRPGPADRRGAARPRPGRRLNGDILSRVIVSSAQRLLFVHVQKTGGLSTDTLLESLLPDAKRVQGLPGTRHAKLRAALRAHPEYADYFIFGFVRNPWARLLSWHAMVLRRTSSAQDGNEFIAARLEANSFWRKVGEEYADFEEFVLRGTREIPRLGTPQVDWLRAPGREADFIGRTESFDADLAAGSGEGRRRGPGRRHPAPQRRAADRLPQRLHPRDAGPGGRGVRRRHRGFRLPVLTAVGAPHRPASRARRADSLRPKSNSQPDWNAE